MRTSSKSSGNPGLRKRASSPNTKKPSWKPGGASTTNGRRLTAVRLALTQTSTDPPLLEAFSTVGRRIRKRRCARHHVGDQPPGHRSKRQPPVSVTEREP